MLSEALRNLQASYNNAHSKKERQEAIRKFLAENPSDIRLSRYLTTIYLTHNRAKEYVAYKDSQQFFEDQDYFIKLLYEGVTCVNCGKPVVPWKQLRGTALNTEVSTCCSPKCHQLYATKQARMVEKSPETIKRAREKARATMLRRYGATATLASKVLSKKVRETNIKRYGYPVSTQNPEVAKRLSESTKKNYQDPDKKKVIREKATQTCIKKYGVSNYAKSEEFKERVHIIASNRTPEEKLAIRQKIQATSLKKYGYEYSSKAPAIREKIRQGHIRLRDMQKDKEKTYCKTFKTEIFGVSLEVQSKNEAEFYKYMVIERGIDKHDLISQFDPDFDDFIYEKIKTFPDFYQKSTNTYYEVKGWFSFFNMFATKQKIVESAFSHNRKKAEKAYKSGVIEKWVICDKLPDNPWKVLFLPDNWWSLPTEQLLRMLQDNNLIPDTISISKSSD